MSSQRNGFGPWSTALDNGTRMQLSAFWRQRVTGLACLSLGPSRRRWSTLVAAVTLLLGLAPLVKFVPKVAAEEKNAAADAAETASESKAKSSNGESWEVRQERESSLLKKMVESGAYDLSPGEPFRFVPASQGGASRRELFNTISDEGGVGTGFFQMKDGKLEFESGANAALSLADAIDQILGFRLLRITGNSRLLDTPMPEGDWIFADDPSNKQPITAERLAAFEETVSAAVQRPILLELKNEEMPALIAKGEYRAQPEDDGFIKLPARRGEFISRLGSFDELLDEVGALLLQPIVNESTRSPEEKDVFWRFPLSRKVKLDEPLDAATTKAVIAAFEKQTGLTLTPEKRTIEVLAVSSEKAK